MITAEKAREIQAAKGGPFSTKFIRKFDKEWNDVREAARRIRERKKNVGFNGDGD